MSTILFAKDWHDNPDAIADMTTKNRSFVRYAALQKSMGNKNHAMVLALHNPDLQGVDPHSPDLTKEQKKLIAIECYENFWYYIREVARTKDGDPFIANRGNIALYWLFLNHITTILIQIRQTGKSFSTDVLMSWLLNIRCENTEINLLTKDEPVRSSNLNRLKEIILQMPAYLRQYRAGFDVGNSEVLTVKALKNIYRGHLPQKSPKLALNVGRGLTSPIFQIDEGAFFPNIGISMPAALAAGTAERNKARRNQDPYGTIITTTSGKKDDRDGAYIYGLIHDAATWTELFFNARDEHDLYDAVRKCSPEKDLTVNCTFNHRQLGYTDEWLETAIREAKATGEAADRDFGNIWTSGTLSSPLTPEQSDMIRRSQIDDSYTEIATIENYITRWYVGPSRRDALMAEPNIMALDTSEAIGKDDIGMVIRNVKSGAVVAAGNYNETNLIKFAQWIVDWLIKYPRLTLIIEKKSSGSGGIIDYIILYLVSKGIDPFRRMYNRIVQFQEEYPVEFALINKPMYSRSSEMYDRLKKYFGYSSSASGANSRSELYGNVFLNSVKLTGHLVHDKVLIGQILGLVIKNNRIDHSVSGHDDMVVAWNMSAYLLMQGKNLKFYGIDNRDVLSLNTDAQKTMSPQAVALKKTQDVARSNFESLLNELKQTKDEGLALRLEYKLRAHERLLAEEDKKHYSLDSLISDLKQKRNTAARKMYQRV